MTKYYKGYVIEFDPDYGEEYETPCCGYQAHKSWQIAEDCVKRHGGSYVIREVPAPYEARKQRGDQ